MSVKILMRAGLAEENELEAARGHFDVITSRTQITNGDLVIGRYSVLPYYKELEMDVCNQGGTLINSYWQHNFIADMQNWYEPLKHITPKTWFSLKEALDEEYAGPYVLKGRTNSRKHLWRTHMYAANKDEARQVYFRLQEDGLIGPQGIVIRKYEQFKNYGHDLSGIPITKEFRFFSFMGQIIDSGFYWANHPEIVEKHGTRGRILVTGEATDLVKDVVRNYARGMCNFLCIDVAETIDGQYKVVELNDGQMAGLSTIEPVGFYGRMRKVYNTAKAMLQSEVQE